ncbi:hypothetical protein GOODEAATRI_022978 [Goodea atripinnis]|uniref:Family with sequence similarity 78 member Ab n=1 Tax=Goodea atripinnis TaxID=208336 RepID=A0ABV0NDU6_9TELE
MFKKHAGHSAMVSPSSSLDAPHSVHRTSHIQGANRQIVDLWVFLWIVLQFSAMGCIQSIKCKPKSFRDSVIVLELNTSIDSNPTSIDEASSVVLRYRTPHFRAQARLLVPPVAAKETWTIGWIQACNHMVFYNTYGDKGM